MTFGFDTSAVNGLHDDPESDVMVLGLLETNTIYVTGLNITEIWATEDEAPGHG